MSAFKMDVGGQEVEWGWFVLPGDMVMSIASFS